MGGPAIVSCPVAGMAVSISDTGKAVTSGERAPRPWGAGTSVFPLWTRNATTCSWESRMKAKLDRLFVAEGFEGIDTRGAANRDPAREQRNAHEKRPYGEERERVAGLDVE